MDMKKNIRTYLSLTILLILSPQAMAIEHGASFFTAPDAPKMAPKLSRKLAQSDLNEPISVWLFFTDKGIMDRAEYEKACRAWEERMAPRVLRRRAKMPPHRTGVDFRDLPVLQNYVEAVQAHGLKVRVVSRWFNGVSVRATAGQMAKIEKLPFIRSMAPVAHFRRSDPKEVQKEPSGKARKAVGTHHRLDYGASYAQLAMIHVPPLHDAGLDGSGIRIGLLDSGFGPLDHEAFQRIDIVEQWDFVEGDGDVGGHPHGTQVLSVIGGYKEGALIGPAYGAEYLLARTEDVESETPVEEDYWIAGVEWADTMGADIVSSSLGYNIWDKGTGEDYTYEDLDGNTARITIAADWAVERGITVISAVGNEGDDPWRFALFPADGDSVIAVGAVDFEGNLAPFSSRGPTVDGRIKPDVAAPGVDIQNAGSAPNFYALSSGTSYAAPLTAGVAALLLQAHPKWGPMEVREALRRSGSHALNPDNEVGWGIINAEVALDAEHTLYGRVVDAGSGRALSMATVTICSDAFEDSTTTGPSGRFLFKDIPDGTYTIGVNAARYAFTRLKDISIPDDLTGCEVKLHEAIDVGDLVYNFPNPFGLEGTCLSFPMEESETVCVQIFTPSGALVWETEHSEQNDRWNVFWDGFNLTGKRVGSGIYFYLIKGDGMTLRGKMSLVR